jgi:hypothetical protein
MAKGFVTPSPSVEQALIFKLLVNARFGRIRTPAGERIGLEPWSLCTLRQLQFRHRHRHRHPPPPVLNNGKHPCG